MRPDGSLAHHAAMFEEDLLIVDIDGEISSAQDRAPWPEDLEQVYLGLVLGLRDYVRKNGFEQVVLGLSGGIDSAFVTVLARDALGPEAVRTLAMPSPYSSPESLDDAKQVASGLGVRLDVLEIGDVFSGYLDVLRETFRGTKEGVAEENLQARIRGNLLMAVSNKFGSLVLATGNKSEYAVGYATLYGDMAGGFAPIKDVPKTVVYELAKWRNAIGEPRLRRSRSGCSTSHRRPSCVRTRRTRTRFRRTTSSTRSSRRTSRTTDRPRTSSPPVVWIRSSWTESSR